MATAEREMGDDRVLRRALVVDESPVKRHGMAAILAGCGIDLAAEVRTVSDAMAALRLTAVDLLMAGVPVGGTAADLVEAARHRVPGLRSLVLVPRLEAGELRRLLAAGPDAVLTSHAEIGEIADAVDRVALGERVVAAAHLGTLLGSLSASTAVANPLTSREMVVLAHLADGRSNRDIAEVMVVSVATVKTHLSHIYDKLGVTGRREAVSRGIELGLLV
jgi:DNA-binding NarL/FixJ family response regulator